MLVVFTNWLPKDSEEADNAAGATPFPLNCAVCGEVGELSFTLKRPLRAPVALGVNVSENLQLPPARSVFGAIGQVEAAAKSPEAVILLIVRGTLKVLFSVTILAVLVVSVAQFPNDTLVELKV